VTLDKRRRIRRSPDRLHENPQVRDELCAACGHVRLIADAVSLITDVKICETAFNDPFRLSPIGSYGYSDSLPKPRIPVRFGVGPCMGLRGGQYRLLMLEASNTIQTSLD
jgi:hypothetical protein